MRCGIDRKEKEIGARDMSLIYFSNLLGNGEAEGFIEH